MSTRYRCAACGNLTRFDVTVTRRTRAFHHYSIGGELTVEDEELLSETVEDVACRWCGSGQAIESVQAAENVQAVEGVQAAENVEAVEVVEETDAGEGA